jgi:CubicO group peptidase (beta-lactamase class C family)
LYWNVVESFIVEKMSEYRMPGLSITVVRGSEVVYSRGFGYRDLDVLAPATPATIYGIGSITKSFTALSILMLAERGLLDVHDPVGRYVGLDLRVGGEPVTLHHLLTHTSGIPALGYAEAFIRGVLGLDGSWLPLSYPDDVMTFMKGFEGWVEARPGERFFYLNEGYVILGKVVERVSGISYEDFVRTNILEPLGMKRSYFRREEVEGDPDVAVGYVIDRDGRHVKSRFPYGVTADGGLLSNPLDMARYTVMLLNRGVYNGVKLLSPRMVELAESIHARLPYESMVADGYGYGLMVKEDFLGRKLVGHGGSVLTYTAYMGYVRGDNVGVIVMSNCSGYPLSLIAQYTLAHTLGYDPEDLEFRKFDRVYGKLQGVYETFKGTMRLTVRRRAGTLVIEYKDRLIEDTTPLTPVKVEEDYALFTAHTLTGRIPVEFRIKGDKIEMLYERYKLLKVQKA